MKLLGNVKNVHYPINLEGNKTETEKYGTRNVKQHRTKPLLSVFFVERNPAPSSDICHVGYTQQCKIKCEPPRHKRDIAQCANWHTKNHCHLRPRCVKRA
jgi:hypothetical protein